MKRIAGFLILILIVLGIALYFLKTRTTDVSEYKNTISQINEETSQIESQVYDLDEIANHNTRDDCWFALSGTVYDVSDFIAAGNHPGRDAILQGCGTDATELFETRPMGSETPHSDSARAFLPEYEIGELVQDARM